MWLRSAWLLTLLGTWAVHADELMRDIEVKDPRPYGHFIGDTLTREVSFEIAKPWQLSPADGAQKLGRNGPWVELIASSVRVTELSAGRRFSLTLTYQIINSPAQATLITVPGITAHLVHAGEDRSMSLPDWLLVLTPLTGSDLRQGLDAQLPSREPRAIEIRRASWRAALGGSLGVLLALWFCIDRWGFVVFASLAGPFGTTLRDLKRLRRQPLGREREHEALRLMHRAFDATAGRRVFSEGLDDFFVRHSEFVTEKHEVRRFFDSSRLEFFGAGAQTSLSDLLQLCERLSAHERASGRRHAAAG